MIDGGYGTIFTHPKDTFGQLQFQTGPPEVPVPTRASIRVGRDQLKAFDIR